MQVQKYVKIWLILLVAFCSSNLLAQERTQDVVELKNGSIIKGEILEYNQEESIKIKIAGGNILVYDANQVQKITTETVSTISEKLKRNDDIPKKGVHYGLFYNTFVGTPGEAIGTDIGMQVAFTVWWQFKDGLALGGGTALSRSLQWSTVPIFLSVRGYFKNNTSGSFFSELNAGYVHLPTQGINPGRTIVEYLEGGWYARPSIGYRFPSKRKTHVGLDIGCELSGFRWGYRTWEWSFVEQRQVLGSYREAGVFSINVGLRLNVLF